MAIDHLFLDEVLWLMADFKEGWDDPRQRELFLCILTLMLHPNILEMYHLN